MQRIVLQDLESTHALASQIASRLRSVLGVAPMTLAICGPLGAGKTQWVRFLCMELGVESEVVTSPTYVLLQRYSCELGTIYHADYYRLQNSSQVWDLGIDELQAQPILLLIEWADKFLETLPSDHLRLDFELAESGTRSVRVTPTGPDAAKLSPWA